MMSFSCGNNWALLDNAPLLLGNSKSSSRAQAFIHGSLDLFDFGLLILLPVHEPWFLSVPIANDLPESTRPTRRATFVTFLLANPTRPASFGSPCGHR